MVPLINEQKSGLCHIGRGCNNVKNFVLRIERKKYTYSYFYVNNFQNVFHGFHVKGRSLYPNRANIKAKVDYSMLCQKRNEFVP
jgi:hypothetical protein